MRGMVTGDQDRFDGTAEGAERELAELEDNLSGFTILGEPAVVENVRCTCEWISMDTGNNFYSRIIKPDPDCRAHQHQT